MKIKAVFKEHKAKIAYHGGHDDRGAAGRFDGRRGR